jgi:hypothetical protein
MGVTIRLPPVGCRSIELVHGKKNFLVIHALGNHMPLRNSKLYYVIFIHLYFKDEIVDKVLKRYHD